MIARTEILVPEKRGGSTATNDRSEMVGLRVGSVISVSNPEVADLELPVWLFDSTPPCYRTNADLSIAQTTDPLRFVRSHLIPGLD